MDKLAGSLLSRPSSLALLAGEEWAHDGTFK
jgi:hypothetical protein